MQFHRSRFAILCREGRAPRPLGGFRRAQVNRRRFLLDDLNFQLCRKGLAIGLRQIVAGAQDGGGAHGLAPLIQRLRVRDRARKILACPGVKDSVKPGGIEIRIAIHDVRNRRLGIELGISLVKNR